MRALMMDTPLLISALLRHAANACADQQIVSRTVAGPIHRYTYAQAHQRSCQLANALVAYGITPGDRIGTIAWNGFRHFEIYFAVSGMGAVCHTMNPRLSPDQLVYIVNHAGDRLLFVDTTYHFPALGRGHRQPIDQSRSRHCHDRRRGYACDNTHQRPLL